MNKLRATKFKAACIHVLSAGITKTALLGASGDKVVLSGTSKGDRSSCVSIRLHNSHIELLITDVSGNFLCYNKYHKNLGVDFIARTHYQTYLTLVDISLIDILSRGSMVAKNKGFTRRVKIELKK